MWSLAVSCHVQSAWLLMGLHTRAQCSAASLLGLVHVTMERGFVDPAVFPYRIKVNSQSCCGLIQPSQWHRIKNHHTTCQPARKMQRDAGIKEAVRGASGWCSAVSVKPGSSGDAGAHMFLGCHTTAGLLGLLHLSPFQPCPYPALLWVTSAAIEFLLGTGVENISLCLKSRSYQSSTTICSKNRGEQWECFTQIVSQRGKNRAIFKHCEPMSSRPSFYVIDFFVTVQLEPPCMSLLLEPFPCTGNDIHAERAQAIFNEETGFVLGAQYEFWSCHIILRTKSPKIWKISNPKCSCSEMLKISPCKVSPVKKVKALLLVSPLGP